MFDHVDAASGSTPQQGVQARHQFVEVERLEQVIIGTGTQASHPILDGIPRAQHQYRERHAGSTQARQQAHAIFIWQAKVQDDDVAMHRCQRGFRLGRAGNAIGSQAMRTQSGQDAMGDQFIIFYQ